MPVPKLPDLPGPLVLPLYGRSGRSSDQFVPGRPYSFVPALGTGRTSWCQLLDAVRLVPADDVAEIAAAGHRAAATESEGAGSMFRTHAASLIARHEKSATVSWWPVGGMTAVCGRSPAGRR